MSKRNENSPGYKKTKVGWIPEEWNCVYGKCAFSHSIERGYDGLPILAVTMESGLVHRSSLDRKMPNAIAGDGSLHVRVGDIAYNMMRAWQGAIGLATEEGVISPAYVVLRPKKHVYSLFMFYLFKSLHGLYSIYSYSYGLTGDRLRLYYKDFAIIPIPLPPLPEQKKIAEILSTWDRAIDQAGKLIDAKQCLKKGLMQQLITGRMRFPEFGKPVFKKDELPEGWKSCKLGACFKERKETNTDIPLLAITSDQGVIPRDEVVRKDTSNADKSKYKRIKPGDIGYNTMRMWQGVSAVSTLEGIVSPAYTICTPKKGNLSSFFGYLFKYHPMIHLFHRFSQGLVSDTLNLKFRHFSQVKANIPSEAEQIRIASSLSTCDREIELLKRKQEKLKEQKKGMMQKLLTGEVRVKI